MAPYKDENLQIDVLQFGNPNFALINDLYL